MEPRVRNKTWLIRSTFAWHELGRKAALAAALQIGYAVTFRALLEAEEVEVEDVLRAEPSWANSC